jgi:hypothetical protein
MKRDGPKAPAAIHGPSGLKYQPLDKANTIGDCFEIQLTSHDLRDDNHEPTVQALLEAADDNSFPKRSDHVIYIN